MTNVISSDEVFMRRALELARNGLGWVEPNPAVGAVVVDDLGTTIGEGWHRKFGGPHAEIEALSAAGSAACGATMYVTLEPCCHYGKTPPCSKAVIAAGLRRVVIASGDPAPHVDGGGIRELREAGIIVDVGLLEQDAKRLVASFVQLMTHHRPWFHAKWAMTLDGKIASRTGMSRWITNESSRAVVHQLRGRMDAIVVGIGTALADDPQLTARPAGPRIATRIVLDSRARLPIDSQLVKSARKVPVMVVTLREAPDSQCALLIDKGVEVLKIACDSQGRPDLIALADELGRRKMTNVLVEGGGQTLGAFFDAGLVDEIHAFIAPKMIGGKAAPSPVSGRGLEVIPDHSNLDAPVTELLDGDIYLHGPTIKE